MKRKFLRFSFIMAILAISAGMLSGGCGKTESNWHKAEGMIWNTTYHLTFNGDPALSDSAVSVLAHIGSSLSVFDTTSLVSRVNINDSTPVNTDFIRVYVKSKQINKLSDGAFDPTVSPLITAWGFGKGHEATPDTLVIDSIMQFIGIRKTRLSHDALIKDDSRIQFNFSAIAKGYGCDAVAEMFEKAGVADYLVEIGGEIRAKGKNPTGTDWKISIDRPVFTDSIIHESQEIIEISDMGMATSGNYRNFHKTDSGYVYGHIISPTTGRPVETDVISATVLSSTAMEADGLATAFMAMGSDRSKELNKSLRLPIMLVLSDSTVWASDQFQKLIVKSEK